MLWGNCNRARKKDRDGRRRNLRSSYIKAAAGKKAEWWPITIKNSTAEHQSPILTGMKPKIWHTHTHIWLAVQTSVQLGSCWANHTAQKNEKNVGDTGWEEKRKTEGLKERGRENVSWQGEWLSFWLPRTVGLWSNILTRITHHFTSLKSH